MFKQTSVQFIKYLFVGGLNFLFGAGIFYFLLHVLYINYLVAFTITWVLGILLTYVINFLWVFKPADKINFRASLAKYFLVYLASYSVNVLLLKILTEYFGQDPFYIQFAIIPVVMVINFLGMKFWSLK